MAEVENFPSERGLSDAELGKTPSPTVEPTPATVPPPSGKLTVGPDGRVTKDALKAFLVNLIKTTSLNGFTPKDGDKYKVDGSAESWANYFVWLCGKESDYKTKDVGDVGLFEGNSNGLFQLSPDDVKNYHFSDTKSTLAQLQDPEYNTTIAVKIHERLVKKANSIRLGAGKYWGPVKRGNTP